MKDSLRFNVLRKTALTVSVAGAVGSLYLLFKAGSNTPGFLLVLFVGWILIPYAASFVLYAIAERWNDAVQATLHVLMMILPIGSVICYSGLFNYSGMKPAFMFVLVPVLSSAIIAIATIGAHKFSRKNGEGQTK